MSLEIGNTWHYMVQMAEPGAPLVPYDRTIEDHMEITYENQKIVVALECPVPDGSTKGLPQAGRLLRNEVDGLYGYGSVEADGTIHIGSRYLVAPLSGQPGVTYPLNWREDLICIAADSLVVTQFGEFKADVYEYVLDEGTIIVPDVYVVPGVGLTRHYNPQYMTYLFGYDFIEPSF